MTPQPPIPVDATTLLSAVPALLGFIPDRSLILIALYERVRVRVAMRYDLSLTPAGEPEPDLRRVLDELGAIVARHGGGPVVAVLADDRFAHTDERYQKVLALTDARLADSGGIAQGFVVGTFAHGATWHLIWHNDFGPTTAGRIGEWAGLLDDPRTTPMAVAAAVSSGRRIVGTRAEIAAMLAPQPHCTSRSCGARMTPPGGLIRAITRAEQSRLLGVVLDAMTTSLRTDCASIAELERAIMQTRVRDAAMACAVTDLRAGAESLWRMLTCRLRGAGKASAAALLAHLHYIGGEGAYAGVALDCALAADSGWMLATLLDQALRIGAAPTMLWEMIDDSYAAAAELGVIIPQVTLRAVG